VTTRVRRIALTGGIATGKSHVRSEFERLGVPTIDSDTLAREAVRAGTPGLAAVVARFGESVLDAGGLLDRRKLAAIVFADPRSRLDLEAIIHPAVREATDRWFTSLSQDVSPFAIADIPLLYEVGRDRDFDEVIVVAADPETQVRRITQRDRITDSEARQRIAAQLPIADKVSRADYVISTEGSIDDTNRQVRDVFARLRGR
jgi:dephospho-CoA kinase